MANRFLNRFEKRFDQILKLPFSGTPRPQLAVELRVAFCEKYAVYYLPHPDEIVIVRVLHGARDAEALAEEGGFGV